VWKRGKKVVYRLVLWGGQKKTSSAEGQVGGGGGTFKSKKWVEQTSHRAPQKKKNNSEQKQKAIYSARQKRRGGVNSRMGCCDLPTQFRGAGSCRREKIKSLSFVVGGVRQQGDKTTPIFVTEGGQKSQVWGSKKAFSRVYREGGEGKC